MINQNIFIINCNPLYEILEEIKENLSFQVIKYKNENEFISKNNSNLKNSLIIVSSTHQLPLNNNLTRNNLLHLKDLPLSIQKIIELINIQLIKLRFNHQSKTTIKNYELDLNSKFISNNNIILKLTEKEIEIILYLNEYKTTHNVLDLQKNIWGYSSEIETHTVETHIYRLRKKISDKFNDQNFILSHQNGYFIK
tara:strand:- start:952 stop:1539 length:588 start_codon:yes stop_codon:yes gene_type:complete